MYNDLKKEQKNVTACSKWESLYPMHDFDWKEIFEMPYSVARETYLQSFHYKLINRYLACNVNLHKWNKAPNPHCHDCKKLDTLEHHLYECQKLQPFWNNLFTWLHDIYGLRINLSIFDILFGITNVNNDKLFDVFNYCILFAKDFIYNTKINRTEVLFREYVPKLLISLEAEQFLASSQNKLDDFYLKWNDILTKGKNN